MRPSERRADLLHERLPRLHALGLRCPQAGFDLLFEMPRPPNRRVWAIERAVHLV